MTLSVSVIIPTIGRNELGDAIASARRQEGIENLEIVVAVDLRHDEVTTALRETLRLADKVVYTGGGKRGGAARNRAIDAAKGDWVAFLDDDDTWDPRKLATQLRDGYGDATRRTVLACQVRQGVRSTAVLSAPTPKRVYSGGPVEDYLFCGRVPAITRSGIYTSTLVVPRAIATETRWDESLSRHQDWDFLVRLQQKAVTLVQVDEPLVTIWSESDASVSASNDWRASLAWGEAMRAGWSRRTFVDFVAGQPLRYATGARSPRGVFLCVSAMIRSRALPAWGPLALGLGGIVPRSLALRVLTRVKRR